MLNWHKWPCTAASRSTIKHAERQERDLRAFAKRAGHKSVAVFKEGADNGRPRRAKVLALARAHEIGAILVTELSPCSFRHALGQRPAHPGSLQQKKA